MFNLDCELILREIDELPEVVDVGNNINNLRYADHTALIANSKDKL